MNKLGCFFFVFITGVLMTITGCTKNSIFDRNSDFHISPVGVIGGGAVGPLKAEKTKTSNREKSSKNSKFNQNGAIYISGGVELFWPMKTSDNNEFFGFLFVKPSIDYVYAPYANENHRFLIGASTGVDIMYMGIGLFLGSSFSPSGINFVVGPEGRFCHFMYMKAAIDVINSEGTGTIGFDVAKLWWYLDKD